MDGALLKSFSCETEGLQLRPLAEGDEPLFHALYGDPETMRFISCPWTPVKAAKRFRGFLDRQGESTLGDRFLVVVRKPTQTSLGICGTSHYDSSAMRLEVGMVLLPLGRKVGIGREALTALVGRAFEEPLVNEVYARVAAGNSAARNLVARIGFRQDCVRRGEGCDLTACEWSVYRSEWGISKSTSFQG